MYANVAIPLHPIAVEFWLDDNPTARKVLPEDGASECPASNFGPQALTDGASIVPNALLLAHCNDRNEGHTTWLIELRLALFVCYMAACELDEYAPNTLPLDRKSDLVINFMTCRAKPLCEARGVQENAADSVTQTSCLDRPCQHTFNQAGKVLLIESEGCIARRACWHHG